MFDQSRRTLALVLLAGASLAGGCAVSDQISAAKSAIPDEQVPGIEQPYSINAVWPEPQWSEFSEIQSRRFYVASADHRTATKLYVVEGKDSQTGKWRVIYAAKLMNKHWTPVQLNGFSPVATAAPVR